MSRDSALGLAQYRCAVTSGNKWAAALGLVLLGATTSLLAQTSGRPNRISQEVSARPMVEISGTVHPLTAKGADLGEVNSNLQLNSMTLHIAPSAAQKTEMASLQQSLQDPKSPQYHKWLTQSEYGARFGLTDADLKQLQSWLTSQGFTVTGVSTSRNAITFGGKAWQAESAFHTQLHEYKLDNEIHFANATALRIPAQFAGVVLTVRGLDTFRPKPNARRVAATPNYTFNGQYHYLSPGDWATIYGLNTVYGQGFDGTGTHIGVVGQTYAPQSEIDNFRNVSGLPPTQLTYACLSGTILGTPLVPSVCNAQTDILNGDLFEADLDIEWAGAIAKNATVDYIYVSGADQTYGVFDALAYAVYTYTTDGTAGGPVLPVISISYASCEANFPPAQLLVIDQVGVQAGLQGQTLVVASGDTGPASCDSTTETTAVSGLSVNVPADSPNFTGVGGTTLSGDTTAELYWDQKPGLVNSALGYIPETAWNETGVAGLAASGGGVSATFVVNNITNPGFPVPAWQSGLISGATGRLVPDVAFAAAAGHDGYLNCSSDPLYGTCATGHYTTAGSALLAVGGTSAATPSFAGMLTLLVQRYGLLGNINPNLYEMAALQRSHPPVAPAIAAFNDILIGDNYVPCLLATTGCNSGPAIPVMGYAAGLGYDLVTGLGSVNGDGMLTALSTYYAGVTTTTKVAVAPTSVAFGSAVTAITATISPSQTTGFTGPVTFTTGNGTTLGTVQSVAGVATLSNIATTTANGLIPGSNAITASYNGGAAHSLSASNYSPSAGTATLVVTPATGTAATTTTVTATPSLVVIGGTTTLSASVTPAGTTGAVTFKVGSTTIGSPTTISGGVATMSNVTVSTANGFGIGLDSITANYSGDASFAPSLSSSTMLTVNSAATAATTTSVTASPSSVVIGGTTTLSASVTPAGTTGAVTFKVGSTTIGTATVSAGTATSNVTVSVANGFSVSPYSIVAIYSGDVNYAPSTSPSTTLTVTAAAVGPTYTFSSGPNSVAGSSNVTLTLNSTGYAGTVSFATSVSSTNGTISNVSASAPPITLTSDGAGTSTLAITAGANAANHTPAVPWKSGGAVVFAAVLLGAPFTRRKRVPAVLLTALAISLAGFLMACNGFFVDSNSTASTAKSARIYTVTVTPTGSGTVTNPASVNITVTVP